MKKVLIDEAYIDSFNQIRKCTLEEHYSNMNKKQQYSKIDYEALGNDSVGKRIRDYLSNKKN